MALVRNTWLVIQTASRCLLGAGAVLAFLIFPGRSAQADDIVEPAVFASSGGVLDILMIAKQEQVHTISFLPPGGGMVIHPTGWVYEVCTRPASSNECPASSTTVSDYGGVR